MKQSLKSYAQGLKFWVKDFAKTSSKYLNYKTEKRNEIDIDIDARDIVNAMDIFPRGNSYAYDLSRKLNCKANIRAFKTCINSAVYASIKSHIDRYTDNTLNDNELKCFTTRAYIENYDEFNQEMLEFLVEYVEDVEATK